MKVILSPNLQRQAILLFGVEILFFVFALTEWNSNDIWGSLLLLCCSVICCLITSLMQLLILRFFTYVICEKGAFTSYLFHKRLCTINKDEKIYYAIVIANEGMYVKKKYIIISNDRFEYYVTPIFRKKNDKKPLISSYNLKTQIAMPYNEKTRSILELDKWHSVM